MTAGTKVFLAVFTLLIAMLVVYYGVMTPGGGDDALSVEGGLTDAAAPDAGTATETGIARAGDDSGSGAADGTINRILEPVATLEKKPSIEEIMSVLGSAAAEDPPSNAGPPVDPRRTADRGEAAAKTADLPVRTVAAATPVKETARAEPPEHDEYVIEAGDTMSSIAADWFGDPNKWDLIAQANPFVDPHAMRLGSTLRLPPRDTRRSGPVIPLDTPGGSHVVRPGETLTGISQAWFGTTTRWRQIYQLNSRKIGGDPNELRVGMKLKMPVGGRVTAKRSG